MSYDGGRLRVLYEMGLPKDGSNVLWAQTCLGTNGRSTRATNLRLCLCCNPHHHHQLIPNKLFKSVLLDFVENFMTLILMGQFLFLIFIIIEAL